MKQEHSKILSDNQENKTIDLSKLLAIGLAKWYLLAIAIIVSTSIAFVKLRYTSPVYSSFIQLKLDDEKSNQLNDFFKFGKVTGKLDNLLKTESSILKSRTYAEKTIRAMNYDFSYYIEGNIVTSQIYPNYLFRLEKVRFDESTFPGLFFIKINSTKNFFIGKSEKELQLQNFNDTFHFQGSYISLKPINDKYIYSYRNLLIHCYPTNLINTAIAFSSALSVDVEKGTSILNIDFVSDVPKFASDYVNTLCKVYIDESIYTKSQAAQQTIDFIDQQLQGMSDKVKSTQNDLTSLKSRNKGFEPEELGKKDLEVLTTLESEIRILQLRKALLEKLEKDIHTSDKNKFEFMSLDKEDVNELPQLFALLNTLITDRISMSDKNTAQSPIMKENERKITEVKSSIIGTIHTVKDKIETKIRYTQQSLSEKTVELQSIPAKQQELLNIERQFKVNEKVYGYLLERKLETQINRSSILANASIIDIALPPRSPISPNTRRTYTVAILIGFAIGLALIFGQRLFYDKVPDKETIESLSETPVIGVIKKINMNESTNADYDLYIFKGPKSIFSESIRGIRSNINFLLKGENKKVICVTSTVSGEGKTFCTINLAAAFTLLNKKVLIVGCDLRRPKIHLSFKNMTNDIGLSTYLIGRNELHEVIIPSEYNNLYVIPAGPAPPNPAELLQTQKMKNLFTLLKEDFDYVLFDTAPVGLVSDSLELMKNADLNLYILRSQYSKRDFALIPDRLKADNQIQNIYTILNSYDASSAIYRSIYKNEYGGYYGGGGYYYYGGYYGKGSYGYYGRKYYSNYYSSYYSDEELQPKSFISRTISYFKKFIKK